MLYSLNFQDVVKIAGFGVKGQVKYLMHPQPLKPTGLNIHPLSLYTCGWHTFIVTTSGTQFGITAVSRHVAQGLLVVYFIR